MSGISDREMAAIVLGSIVCVYLVKLILDKMFYLTTAIVIACAIYFCKNKRNNNINGRTRPNEKKGASDTNGPGASRETALALNEMMTDLKKTNIIMVGVYGSSSAKKDTVVKKIRRRVKLDNLFDVVVRVSVTKKPDLKNIQGELGYRLGVELREKSLEARASLLCAKIKTNKEILIILDDVWDQINLGRIGIPFGNDHPGCKILLISETQNILSNQTDCQIKLKV